MKKIKIVCISMLVNILITSCEKLLVPTRENIKERVNAYVIRIPKTKDSIYVSLSDTIQIPLVNSWGDAISLANTPSDQNFAYIKLLCGNGKVAPVMVDISSTRLQDSNPGGRESEKKVIAEIVHVVK